MFGACGSLAKHPVEDLCDLGPLRVAEPGGQLRAHGVVGGEQVPEMHGGVERRLPGDRVDPNVTQACVGQPLAQDLGIRRLEGQ